MIDRATALIDLAALQHNYTVVRELIPPRTKIMAMIKANAYGHGLLPVAKALMMADELGVATLDEAVNLRQAGVTQPISVMTGFTTAEELSLFFEYQLSPVIHHPLHLALLAQADASKPMTVWLKIDTGMHRLGFSVTDFLSALATLSQIKVVAKPVRLMTHLADADNSDRQFTNSQLQSFLKLTKALPGIKSINNSAGIIAYPNMATDVVRPGIMLYGASPFANRLGQDFNLKPVMQLQSKIIAIKAVKKGDYIGYSCTWRCPEDMRVAVIAIGYGDGYPRHIKNKTPVLINGVSCPTVGRVSMDMITVDIRQQPHCRVGDAVILWGAGLPIETIAASAETITYELLCRLTQRVKITYL